MDREHSETASQSRRTDNSSQQLFDDAFDVRSSADPSARPQALASFSGFQNALLVHQKRLKVSSTQLFRASLKIDSLIANYYFMMSVLKINGFRAGPDDAHQRKMTRIAVSRTIEYHDSLLEERRRFLQYHGALLESASEVDYLKITDKLLEAIDLQITAAEDLAERMEARTTKTDWRTFKHRPLG